MKDLEKKIRKKYGKFGEGMIQGIVKAELRVTPENVQITGNKPAILSLVSSLINSLAYETEGNFTKEDIEYAVKLGFMSEEELKEEEEESEGEELDIDNIVDKLKEMLDKLKK